MTQRTAPAADLAGTITRGGTGRYVLGLPLAEFDPRTTGAGQWLGAIMSRLVRTVHGDEARDAADFTLKPDLALGWEQPDDLQRLTVRLRHSVAWHDKPPVNGRELTSADIQYSYESYARNPPHPARLDLLDRIETPDRHTATFVLKQPFSGLLDVLAVPSQWEWVLAPEVAEQGGGHATTVVGTGPFVHEDAGRGAVLAAERNPRYFEPGLPYLDRIEASIIAGAGGVHDHADQIAAFRAGRLDLLQGITPADAADLKAGDPAIVIEEHPGTQSGWGLFLNPREAPYSDPRVRRAIALAIDRHGQRQRVFQGHGTLGWGIPYPFAQEEPWTEEQLGPWWRHDPAEARRLLAAAGHGDGFAATLTYHQYWPSMSAQVRDIQAQLKATLNIDVTVNHSDHYDTWDAAWKGREVSGMAWGFQLGMSATVDDFCYWNLHSRSPRNYWGLADTEIDRLAEAIRAEPDGGRRRALVGRLCARDQDLAGRLFMPSASFVQVRQPSLRGFAYLALRGGISVYNDSPARAQHWRADEGSEQRPSGNGGMDEGRGDR